MTNRLFHCRSVLVVLLAVVLVACGDETINDDNGTALAAIGVSPVSIDEGDSGTQQLIFTITLDKSADDDVSVDFSTSDGSASAGSDYQSASGTVTIPKGSLSSTVAVTILGDTDVEQNETFTLMLTNPVNADLNVADAVGSIINDDTAAILVTIGISPVSIDEGDSGTQQLIFTITLDKFADDDVSVDFSTSDGSASAGSDYQSASGTVTIPKGSLSSTVAVSILGDTDIEQDESFTLTLTNPVNATLGTAEAAGSIVNDDVFVAAGSCTHTGSGNDYPVGPGLTYATISEVPWGLLGPGDTVRIHYKTAPYKEKIVISTDGTVQEPIRVCGVAGLNGERPILDGDGAVNDPDDSEAYGTYEPMEGLAMVMLWNRDYDLKVHNIVIDGLHIRNAKNTFSYTRVDGSSDSYEGGAACIRIQAGDNIVIRNNELENCGNGIFTMSQEYNEASLTRNLLIEGNYLHGHGQSGSGREHAVYIQAIGATYQYNHFGPNTAGSEGATLKERVAGSVIRYNWFDSGSSRVLDLVEVEDAGPWYLEQAYRDWAAANGEAIDPTRLEKVRTAEAAYRETYVYGNFINHVGSQTSLSGLFHYGWDNDPEWARKGTLYFYNNTVSILNDRNDSWRVRLFDIYLYDESAGTPAEETVEVFNNIIYSANETAGADPSYFCLGRDSGTINLGVNWMTNSWDNQEARSECYPYEGT